MVKHHLELQIASASTQIPDLAQFEQWAAVVLADYAEVQEIVIRIVDEDEMSELNESYRHKVGPTNILSFPFEAHEAISLEINILGDLVLCAPVIENEAQVQGKTLEQHWAHIFIHGILHLLGYDHIEDQDAETMEALEIELLSKLHINNPYQEQLS